MTEQTPEETDEPEAAADDALDVSDVVEDDADAEPPDTEASADSGDDAGDGGGGDDDEPARDPDAQAAVDDVSDHSTKVRDSTSGDPADSEFRTPPGIPGGLDPGTLADRDK
jgi:hypothetical protein